MSRTATAVSRVMGESVSRGTATFKYAPQGAVQGDPKVGPIARLLRAIGFSATDAGAHQRTVRTMADLRIIAGVAMDHEHHIWFDQYMAPIDETRAAATGPLDDKIKLKVEEADAADNIARFHYAQHDSLDNARKTILAAHRCAQAHLAYARGVRGSHPELSR